MQINRLFEIIYLLLDEKRMTARGLADHFEVSVRTIYRDIEALCEAGIPLYTSKGRGGGVSLMEGFVLDKSVLSGQEKNEILWALQSMGGVNGDGQALSKLKSLFGGRQTDWIEIDFSDWDERRRDVLRKVRMAVLEQRVLEFDYYNSRGEKSRRRAEPLKLWFKHRAWYVKAYCLNSGGYRLFKLNRIRQAEVLAEHFGGRPLEEMKLEETRSEEKSWKETVEVEMVIDESQAYRVYDEYEEDCIVKREDGSFLVRLVCPETDWVYGYILSYGPAARVLRPERIRDIIVGRLEGARRLYL